MITTSIQNKKILVQGGIVYNTFRQSILQIRVGYNYTYFMLRLPFFLIAAAIVSTCFIPDCYLHNTIASGLPNTNTILGLTLRLLVPWVSRTSMGTSCQWWKFPCLCHILLSDPGECPSHQYPEQALPTITYQFYRAIIYYYLRQLFT